MRLRFRRVGQTQRRRHERVALSVTAVRQTVESCHTRPPSLTLALRRREELQLNNGERRTKGRGRQAAPGCFSPHRNGNGTRQWRFYKHRRQRKQQKRTRSILIQIDRSRITTTSIKATSAGVLVITPVVVTAVFSGSLLHSGCSSRNSSSSKSSSCRSNNGSERQRRPTNSSLLVEVSRADDLSYAKC